jgi:phosphatidylglycerol---prolipoprotein diacylglyceryl transferase
MFPEIGTIGPLTFYSFGLMLALALVIAGWFMAEDLRQRGMDPGRAFELVLAAAVGGLIGARVYYVIDNPDADAGLLSGSGLTFYGSLIGGVLAVVAVALWRRLPVGVVANLAAPALALGIAIGRIGCQLAGDGDYGIRSDLPWAMSYPDGTVPTIFTVHPTPIYETAIMLGTFWLLWRLRGRLLAPWSLFGLWAVIYGVERFLMEFIRRNPEELWGLTAAQLSSIALVAIGLGLLWRTWGRLVAVPARP